MWRAAYLVLGAAVLAVSTPVHAVSLPDTPLNRARAQMAVQELEIMLLTHPSATLALEAWCTTHHLADSPVVTARKVTVAEPDDAPPAVRADLGVSATQRVRHRQVQLVCGAHVLSVADNWYVPDRLPAQMNVILEQTDTSFGHVVAPLHFSRTRLEFDRLWSPWPGLMPAASLAVPAIIVRQRAVLHDEHGQPFSEVVETYTDQTLDFLSAG
ncbi:hypothetical protein D3W54_03865 [Komagataeibacter medellinensis]|uniref:Chorismate lyase n=1 Tax=Komagataeibacter medellinensis TaxID=1177712 RepID=A0ABQ6VTH5_9PROT|nr:hypothetical protein [Komagataeibacter medellinensis]KAB8123483.1 hypothetical protein D3W54_03865 [Komagataeibacter medellinensis]